jgi:hypothetical protein
MLKKVSFINLLFMGFYPSSLLSQDPLTLSDSDVARLSPSSLSNAVSQLRSLNTQEETQYNQMQSFNTEMCKQLAQINTQCVTQTHLLQPTVSDDTTGCGLTSSNPVLKVSARNLKGYRFRIKANKNYISDEFAEGETTLTFHRDDNQETKPPRFREITSLTLVSVVPGSTITSAGYIQKVQTIKSADQAALINSMQFQITVDDKPLIDDPQAGTLKIQAPSDSATLSELRVDIEAILKMGKSEKCVLSPSVIAQIRQSSEQSSESDSNSSSTSTSTSGGNP